MEYHKCASYFQTNEFYGDVDSEEMWMPMFWLLDGIQKWMHVKRKEKKEREINGMTEIAFTKWKINDKTSQSGFEPFFSYNSWP